MITINPEPLTKKNFAAFGGVVEVDGAQHYPINQGFAERFNDLANVDVATEGGRVNVSVVAATPRPHPIALKIMERHPLGSQIFFPLKERPWLVVVCENPHDPKSFHAFSASGRQGINYARNTWHHPLLVLDTASRFLIIDRQGPGTNLEEIWLDGIVGIAATWGGLYSQS